MLSHVSPLRHLITNTRRLLFDGAARTRRLRSLWRTLVCRWAPKSRAAQDILYPALSRPYMLSQTHKCLGAFPAVFPPAEFGLNQDLVSSSGQNWSYHLYHHQDHGHAPEMHYVRNAAEAEDLCKTLFIDPNWQVLGFDAEFAQTIDGEHEVAMIQIASQSDILVIQIAAFQDEWAGTYALTPSLVEIIGSNNILKVGSGIDASDAAQLANSFGATSRALIDLGEYDRRIRATVLKRRRDSDGRLDTSVEALIGKVNIHGTLKPQLLVRGLAAQTKHYLGLPLSKEYQRGSWAMPDLPDAAIRYAANDAYASLMVFHALERFRATHLADCSRPIPVEVVPTPGSRAGRRENSTRRRGKLHGHPVLAASEIRPVKKIRTTRMLLGADANIGADMRTISSTLCDQLLETRSALALAHPGLDVESICPPAVLAWLIDKRPVSILTTADIETLKSRWTKAGATAGAEFAVQFAITLKQAITKLCEGKLHPVGLKERRLLNALRMHRLHLANVWKTEPSEVLPDLALLALAEGKMDKRMLTNQGVNPFVLQSFMQLQLRRK